MAESAAAFASVFGNPGLRRLELAWAWSIVGHWSYLVAVSVYAYDVGGTAAVGLIFALRMVPAAFIAPFAGMLGDRYQRDRVLLASSIARIVLIGTAAVGVFLDVAPAVVYGLAVAAAIATTPFRSAQAALTPSLARTPGELTSANAVASSIESLAIFIGPALAGLLLAIASTGSVFVVTAAMLVVCTYYLVRLDVPRAERKPELEASTIVSEAFAGFRTVGRNPSLRVLIGFFSAQTFVAGALQVYTVVLAFEILDQGEAGVGFLNSAMGIGALLGGLLSLSLTGARRLSRPFVVGVILWGAPLIVLGLWAETVPALILFGIVGVGATTMDVAGFTLVQRAVPDEVLARVFGVIQMLWILAVAIGALVAPAFVDWLGVEDALIATGAALVALVALLWRQLAEIDAAAIAPEAGELRLLTAVPIFTPLPGTSLEHLAARLIPLRIEEGATIVREGDAGDRFYIVAEGTVEVSQDGNVISELAAGGYFGEIALIRDLPRTATVTAKTPVVVYGLEREDFLAAVTGHSPSAQAAEDVVSARLATLAPSSVRVGAS